MEEDPLTISDISHEVLWRIFRQLPKAFLFRTVRLVCTDWDTLIVERLLSEALSHDRFHHRQKTTRAWSSLNEYTTHNIRFLRESFSYNKISDEFRLGRYRLAIRQPGSTPVIGSPHMSPFDSLTVESHNARSELANSRENIPRSRSNSNTNAHSNSIPFATANISNPISFVSSPQVSLSIGSQTGSIGSPGIKPANQILNILSQHLEFERMETYNGLDFATRLMIAKSYLEIYKKGNVDCESNRIEGLEVEETTNMRGSANRGRLAAIKRKFANKIRKVDVMIDLWLILFHCILNQDSLKFHRFAVCFDTSETPRLWDVNEIRAHYRFDVWSVMLNDEEPFTLLTQIKNIQLE